MARIKGVEIPNEKKIKISLTYIYGIGRTTAMKILNAVKLIQKKEQKIYQMKNLVRFVMN